MFSVRSPSKDVTLVESGTGDVHIFTDGLEKRSLEVHRHFNKSGRGTSSIATVDPKLKRASVKSLRKIAFLQISISSNVTL